jgi:hypothetical protein
VRGPSPLESQSCACRKSNPNILVVQPAQDRAAKNGPGQFDGARDRTGPLIVEIHHHAGVDAANAVKVKHRGVD